MKKMREGKSTAAAAATVRAAVRTTPPALPSALTDAAANGTLVPLVGAGVSRQAVPIDSPLLPTWRALLEALAETAGEGDQRLKEHERQEITQLLERRQYLLAAQAVRDALPPDVFGARIRALYLPSEARPAGIHRAILDLGSRAILTTNYDRLLEDAYASGAHGDALSRTYLDAPALAEHLRNPAASDPRPFIFKMHGDALGPADMILTEKSYRVLLRKDLGYQDVMSSVFLSRTVVLLGFSGDDPSLSVFFRTMNESLHRVRSPDFMLLPRGAKGPVERRLYRDFFGLQVVEYDDGDNHAELGRIVASLAAVAKGARRGSGGSGRSRS